MQSLSRWISMSVLAVALVVELGWAQPSPQAQARDNWKLGEIRVHDPWILADNSTHTYFLYTASRSMKDGKARGSVIVYQSKDLATWSGPTTVFEVPDTGWAEPSDGLWAPEIHFYQGHYYLLATLHNNAKLLPSSGGEPAGSSETQIEVRYRGLGPHARGTQVFVGDSPTGPFRALVDRPAPSPDSMTLDGTLFVEDGQPYMVYAHEWIQLVDGAMEAIPLTPDLAQAAGGPIFLFKASDAPWLRERTRTTNKPINYVTDGPELYRTAQGKLCMIWSSFRDGKYVETLAHSESGKLRGPWLQDNILVGDDSGHGMIFHAFDGRLMLVVHHPNDGRLARPNLYQLEETNAGLRIKADGK